MELVSAWPGLLVLLLVVAGWVAVQTAWRRSFPEPGGELDALAGRGGCAGCRGGECTDQCHDASAKRSNDVGRQVR